MGLFGKKEANHNGLLNKIANPNPNGRGLLSWIANPNPNGPGLFGRIFGRGKNTPTPPPTNQPTNFEEPPKTGGDTW
jgi:hypothetical protein